MRGLDSLVILFVCGCSQLVWAEPGRTTPASLFADPKRYDAGGPLQKAENISQSDSDPTRTTPGVDVSLLGLVDTATFLHDPNAPLTELLRRAALLGRRNQAATSSGGRDVIALSDKDKTALANQVAQCADGAAVAVRYYCINLPDGLYHDPWNPWCGFIKCAGGLSVRKCCRQGTWMGLPDLRRPGRKSLCRQRLIVNVDQDRCPQATDFDLCRNAKDVDTGLTQPQVETSKTEANSREVPDAIST